MSALVHISVTKWEDFQEREDRANYVWFKFSNSYFSDPKMFPLSLGARFLFVYILCERSKTSKNLIDLNLELSAFTLRTDQEAIANQINELVSVGVVRREIPGNSRIDACLDKKDKKDKKRAAENPSEGVPHPIVKAWNENRGSLAGIRGCSVSRLKHINARWLENPSEAFWIEVIQRIAASPFCNGKGTTGWKADFDFLLKPDTANKALEGKYDDRSQAKTYQTKTFTLEEIKAINEGRTQ